MIYYVVNNIFSWTINDNFFYNVILLFYKMNRSYYVYKVKIE